MIRPALALRAAWRAACARRCYDTALERRLFALQLLSFGLVLGAALEAVLLIWGGR